MTSSGNLSNCKHIIHVSAKDVRGWEKVISNMLEEANKKKIGSIAMPLLGTGEITNLMHNNLILIYCSSK